MRTSETTTNDIPVTGKPRTPITGRGMRYNHNEAPARTIKVRRGLQPRTPVTGRGIGLNHSESAAAPVAGR